MAPDEHSPCRRRPLDLYRYVGGAEHTGDYLAIMGLFSSGLLVDLSAAEVADRLGEGTGTALDVARSRTAATSWSAGATWCARSAAPGCAPSPPGSAPAPGTRSPSSAAGCTARCRSSSPPPRAPARCARAQRRTAEEAAEGDRTVWHESATALAAAEPAAGLEADTARAELRAAERAVAAARTAAKEADDRRLATHTARSGAQSCRRHRRGRGLGRTRGGRRRRGNAAPPRRAARAGRGGRDGELPATGPLVDVLVAGLPDPLPDPDPDSYQRALRELDKNRDPGDYDLLTSVVDGVNLVEARTGHRRPGARPRRHAVAAHRGGLQGVAARRGRCPAQPLAGAHPLGPCPAGRHAGRRLGRARGSGAAHPAGRPRRRVRPTCNGDRRPARLHAATGAHPDLLPSAA